MSPLDAFSLAAGLTPPPAPGIKKENTSGGEPTKEAEGEDLSPLFYQVCDWGTEKAHLRDNFNRFYIFIWSQSRIKNYEYE